jgi:hypothetical protein
VAGPVSPNPSIPPARSLPARAARRQQRGVSVLAVHRRRRAQRGSRRSVQRRLCRCLSWDISRTGGRDQETAGDGRRVQSARSQSILHCIASMIYGCSRASSAYFVRLWSGVSWTIRLFCPSSGSMSGPPIGSDWLLRGGSAELSKCTCNRRCIIKNPTRTDWYVFNVLVYACSRCSILCPDDRDC